MLNIISIISLIIIAFCTIYLWIIALASIWPLPRKKISSKLTRFAIAIPAHNEAAVIGSTVANLNRLHYPKDLFDIFVVADFCSDRTAQASRDQGAICFERTSGERGGKGSALRFLFERIFERGIGYHAVVIFDADTSVDPYFLEMMDARLEEGAQVIQGRHVISNPHDGWFPALTWAMMTINNRLYNQGRNKLGLSAKHMGDSICFKSDVLRNYGWGSGLTEDFEFRLRLLLEGIRVKYEPRAIGYGESPRTWKEAQDQRLRWAKGVADSRKRYSSQLLREGLYEKNWLKLDGALSTLLPSYSLLSLVSIFMFAIQLAFLSQFWGWLVYTWGVLAFLLFIYPLLGLLLERAPWWAYAAILSGPIFMVWRTWLHLRVRISRQEVAWVRTTHHGG